MTVGALVPVSATTVVVAAPARVTTGTRWPPASGGDRRGSASPGADRRGGGGTAQGGDRRAASAPANSAMAEALRRACFLDDSGQPSKDTTRRSDRPETIDRLFWR